MQEYNIITDIAGEYKTMMALLRRMPKSAKILCLGDMVDRGPDSRKVLLYLYKKCKEGKAICLMGNHEHMLLDFLVERTHLYTRDDWENNGGMHTLENFPNKKVPLKILKWIKGLPIFFEDGCLFASHAPWFKYYPFDPEDDSSVMAYTWNREVPKIMPGKTQVFGHNSHWGLQRLCSMDGAVSKEGDLIGYCLDTSKTNKLTGLHWPSLEIFSQTFI
jgi:serine/threonine protein phosphatase 1